MTVSILVHIIGNYSLKCLLGKQGLRIKHCDLSGMFFADKGTDIQSYPVTRLSSHASCNVETNERGLRLLEFATFNNLVLTNILDPHLTNHPEEGHDKPI